MVLYRRRKVLGSCVLGTLLFLILTFSALAFFIFVFSVSFLVLASLILVSSLVGFVTLASSNFEFLVYMSSSLAPSTLFVSRFFGLF